jgi:hypothetical protein
MSASIVNHLAIPPRFACGFLGRRRIVASTNYSAFGPAATMIPGASDQSAFVLDCANRMANLKEVESR